MSTQQYRVVYRDGAKQFQDVKFTDWDRVGQHTHSLDAKDLAYKILENRQGKWYDMYNGKEER